MRRVFIWAAFFCFAAAMAADPPLFKAESRLILLVVNAIDASGSPVRGLGGRDFTILEDGVVQPLRVFEAHPSSSAQATARGSSPSIERRFLLFFDVGSMSPQALIRATHDTSVFIREHMTPFDSVATLTSRGASTEFSAFTTDRNSLLENLKAIARPYSERSPPASRLRENGPTASDQEQLRVFETLANASRSLATCNGKKAIILFSGGMLPPEPIALRRLQGAINTAVASNVVIYAVDVRGLEAIPPGGEASVADQPGVGILPSGPPSFGVLSSSRQLLNSLSVDTGGRPTFDSNDLTSAILLAQRELSSYYVLGYYSSSTERNSLYRRVRVVLNNKQTGIRLRYRDRYYQEESTVLHAEISKLQSGAKAVLPANGPVVVRQAERLSASAKVYDAQPAVATDAPEVLAFVEVLSASDVAFRSPTFNSGRFAGLGRVMELPRIDIPLVNLAPGRYILQLTAVDTITKSFAFDRRELEVVP